MVSIVMGSDGPANIFGDFQVAQELGKVGWSTQQWITILHTDMRAKAIVGACVGPLWFDVTVDFHFKSQSHHYESKKGLKMDICLSESL